MTSGRVFGKYDVLRRLAAGGMGEIYLARQRGVAGFDRLIILKTLLPQLTEDEESVKNFLDEARIVGCINHPNVVAMYEVGEHNGEYVMAMEHVHGLDLSLLRKAGLKANAPMPARVAAAIVQQAALGLDAVHRARDARGQPLKVVHRDVSPQNIMVRADGNVKLLDFGVARAEQKQSRTQHGQLKGKLGYMSPEQIRTLPIDGRHDQWSLGVVLWELLTGKRLFRAPDMVAVMKMILGDAVAKPSSIDPKVPAVLDDIVLHMLQKDPNARYPTLGDVAEVLKKAIEVLPGPSGELGQYVQIVVGDQLEEQLRILLSEAPEQDLPAAAPSKKTCERCSFVQPTTNRFCASCGASLEVSESGSVSIPGVRAARRTGLSPAPVALADPPEPAPRPGRSGSWGDLPPDEGISSERVNIPMPMLLAAQVGSAGSPNNARGAPTGSAHATLAFVRPMPTPLTTDARAALAAHATRRGGSLFPIGAEAVVAAFGLGGVTEPGAAADRALAFALEASVLLAPFHTDARVVVCHGEVRAAGGSIAGVGLDRVRMLAGLAHAPGVTVETDLQPLLSRRLKDAQPIVIDDPHFAAGAVEVVGGPATCPSPTAFGRDLVHSQIAGYVADAHRGAGSVIAISGGPGVGKSALLNEVAPLCAWKGMLVARASCSLKAAAPPLDVVRQLVRSCLVELAAESQRPAMGLRGLEVGLDASGLAPGDQARILALFSTAPHAEALSLVQRATALRASLARLLLITARRYGLGLLIDDAHKMDHASRAFLDHLVPLFDRERAVLFVAMDPKIAARPFHNARVQRVAPLEPAAVHALLASTCGPVSAAVQQWVKADAAGNPRAALCAIGLYASSGAIQKDGAQWEPTPGAQRPKAGESLPELAEAVVRKLSAQNRNVLASVAVAGGAVPDDPAVFAAYDEAAALGLAAPRINRPAPLSPTLQRALVQTAERMGAKQLRDLHATAAARAQTRLAQDPAALDVLAFHRRFADPSGVALDEHVAALARHVIVGVLEPLRETGIQLAAAVAQGRVRRTPGGDGEAMFDVIAASCEAQLDLDAAAALLAIEGVLATCSADTRSPALARLARLRAHAFARSGRHAQVPGALATAAGWAAEAGASSVAALVSIDLGRAAEAHRDFTAALGAYADAAALGNAPGAGEEEAVWMPALSVATLCARQGNHVEAQHGIESAKRSARGSPLAGAAIEAVLARITPQGEEHAESAVAAADRAADVTSQVFCRQLLAERVAARGDWAQVRAILAEAGEVARTGLYAAGVDAIQRALAAMQAR